MKKVLVIALSLVTLVACKGKEQEETIVLETAKQKLSYALGVDFATPIVEAGEDARIFDFDAIAKGFETGLGDNDFKECQQTLELAFGMNFSNPDSTKKVEGSECFGKINGYRFYQMLKELNQINEIDLKYIAYGYRDGLKRADSILPRGERAQILTEFQTKIQTQQMKKMQDMDRPFMEAAKSKANTRVIDGGIVIETLKEGNGGSPLATDDVKAHYTLTNAQGDKMESSLDRGEPLVISLGQVIPGWTMAFPQLKKGGKYKLYIPSDLAYGKGALCFEVELIDFGKTGTVK